MSSAQISYMLVGQHMQIYIWIVCTNHWKQATPEINMQFDYAYAHVVIFRVQYILAADTESASC